ncbi:MAG: hypothetical protein V1779_05850 [bacterium]
METRQTRAEFNSIVEYLKAQTPLNHIDEKLFELRTFLIKHSDYKKFVSNNEDFWEKYLNNKSIGEAEFRKENQKGSTWKESDYNKLLEDLKKLGHPNILRQIFI